MGPILKLTVRPSRRTVRLMDGTVVRRGDPIGVIHLNNERVVTLHAVGLQPGAIGIRFRRQLVASFRELTRLAAPGGSLVQVRAFTATTILHHGLGRLGFEPARDGSGGSVIAGAYQRVLLASLRPAGSARLGTSIRHRARQLWMSREALQVRFHHSEHLSGEVHTPPA